MMVPTVILATASVLDLTLENLNFLRKSKQSNYFYDCDGNNLIIIGGTFILSEINFDYFRYYFEVDALKYILNNKGNFL